MWTVQNFRRKVLRELKKIKLAWPELNYATAPGVLILHPSTPCHRAAQSRPARQARLPLSRLSAIAPLTALLRGSSWTF